MSESTDNTLPVCPVGERLGFLVAYSVVIRTGGGVLRIEIPEGYTWDGASIPRWAWPLVGHPFSADLRLASLVHDWRCEHARTPAERMVGDALFLELLEKAGLPRWRRVAMWLAVRLHSVFFWKAKGNGSE